MENGVKAILKQMLVKSVHIDVDSEKIAEQKVGFEAASRSELGVPKDSEDKTFLLSTLFEIHDKGRADVFNASVAAEFYFELDINVDDYDDIVQKQCLPIIQKEMTSFANKVLGNMGHPEFLAVRE